MKNLNSKRKPSCPYQSVNSAKLAHPVASRKRLIIYRKTANLILMHCGVRNLNFPSYISTKSAPPSAMTAAQSRIAGHVDVFYGSADRTSEGAMAANAYKRSVDDLEGIVTRELAGL